MAEVPHRARVAARVTEALVLSALAGGFAWVVAQILLRMPLLPSALAGFLAGGAATMRTMGFRFHHHRPRLVLATCGALLAYASIHALDYARFVHFMREAQIATDYRVTPAEADQRIAAELREKTGHAGPLGYCLAAVKEGMPVGPLQPRGAGLLLFWLIDAAVAVAVALWWARA